ncbi:MAG: hypothetical protein LC123_13100 [Burkholderiales bacterium]|jgi:hypothetical protein|nr:hypothetical protein [Rhodocyclaceae bacterium]MCZ2174343.1 hypothetical protein [Burkholderiales bacterium]HNQ58230.1 hypothetical protein [Candidatus Desulfobacillus denitrificans]MCQ3925121.1 hypothetical protein [Rhodocyclaceae bacterium]MCZ2420755.1 hypothetical protein [Burkholderiales bacterium]
MSEAIAVPRGLTFAALALCLGGCYHVAKDVSDSLEANAIARSTDSAGATKYSVPATSLVPNASLKLTPNLSLSLENMLIGAAIYFFVDPLAPNWEGEMKRLSEDTFSIALRSKRFRSTGGDGEAGRVFKRNADQIVREGGFSGYQVLAYSEGIESELIGAYRYAEGTIRISRR